ncbi:flagellar hook capping FlgD N-terminal domain-containing protein [Vagococcus penaei]|uniref:Flagellar basal body rod modification protein n=1 Tax=Vagococcus penaei TaxID=633807 RepID=A0A1Q2D823_9ENTE|nr:flagellar hook capping FlgD N-terminal domain-containing protein [Vagococcus penaei]AQP54568.1 hypothetical protein BW732_10385 [Vagococcus penaei]
MADINSFSPMGRTQMQQAEMTAQKERSSGSDIKMDDFLKILAATMSNPSLGGESGSGGSNTDYISQLVQFTTLEQLKELGTNMEHTMLMAQQQQAITMIGQTVTLMTDDNQTVTGTIDGVKFLGGIPTIKVAGKNYLMSQITELAK